MSQPSNQRPLKRAALLLLAVLLAACGSNTGNSTNNSNTPQAAPNALHILFDYSSEKQPWLDSVIKTFNASNTKTTSGQVIFVDTKVLGSGEMMSNIVDGTDQPALWSPASNIWIPLLNEQWSQKNSKDLISETCKNLVLSPVVIMMWKPFAQALGWPDKPIGWADIAKISTDPQGWADYGKPQWGAFRFGHTHPDYSNSGFQTIIAMAYAATGKQRGLTVADVQAASTAKFVSDVESSVAHYGSSTGFFGDNMISRGTSYLSAAVVYESVVVSSYDPSKHPEFPLVAIYPKEGTFQSDHPACIPDGSWVNADQKDAATILRNYLLSQPVQQQALQVGFRPADPSIAVGAPIDADHGVDPKQPQNTLAVPDAKTIHAVRDLWQQNKRKVNLTLLIDISGSMRDEDKMAHARDGASAFIDLLDPSDNLTLIAFDDQRDVIFDNLNVGQNKQKMKAEVSTLLPRNGTALYDSIAYSVQNMNVDPARINAVVVLTDGQDTSSTQYKARDTLIAALKPKSEGSQAEVSIFTIGYGSDADDATLKAIADAGHGAYWKGTTTNIQQVYRDISTFF